jgi:hypothetical protein
MAPGVGFEPTFRLFWRQTAVPKRHPGLTFQRTQLKNLSLGEVWELQMIQTPLHDDPPDPLSGSGYHSVFEGLKHVVCSPGQPAKISQIMYRTFTRTANWEDRPDSNRNLTRS